MPLRLALCLTLAVAASAETDLERNRREFDANRAAIDAYWAELVKKAPEGDVSKITGSQIYDPTFTANLKTEDQVYYFDHKARTFMKAVIEKRNPPDGPERELMYLFGDSGRTPKGNGANQVMKENPAVRELLWNVVHGGPAGEAQRKRLLDGYAEAKKSNPDLKLMDYLKGLTGDSLTKALAGDKVTEKKDDEKLPKKEERKGDPKPASEQARAAAGSDTMASVGFDGSQAYGVFGDRHVYKDKAGNTVSFSVSSRRMPDGTMEDVVHIVNINNRTAPQGATFSLRTEADKLAAGVTVTIGGLPVTIAVKPSGDDHSISISGPGGPLVNAKGEAPMSLNQSYAYRAARVFSYGRVVEIGGKEYYVSPETYTTAEGGKDAPRSVGYGQFAYWPKDQLDGLFAQREGRDEVNPQTMDFKTLDLKGSKFGSVRDMRPDFIATVIRREGAQDVALPRASMGQDSKGQWWDAVLRDGKYVIEKGQAPAVGHQPDGSTPPGQVRSDGWPQLGTYSPDGPEASRLNALLSTSRVKIYEATGATEFDKKFIIMFDKDFKSIVHPQFVGQGTGGFTQVLGLEVLGGKVIAAASNMGVSYMDADGSAFRDGRPELKSAGQWTKEDGFKNVSDAAVLKHALGLAGYSEADAGTIMTRVAQQVTDLNGKSFSVGGLPAGKDSKVALNVTRDGAASMQVTVWPTLGKPEAGSAEAPAGTGFVLDSAGPAAVVHDQFFRTLTINDKPVDFVKGDVEAQQGAAVYKGKKGEVYVVFTVRTGPDKGTVRRYNVRAWDFEKNGIPASIETAQVAIPTEPKSGELKVEPRLSGNSGSIVVLFGGEVVGTPLKWTAP